MSYDVLLRGGPLDGERLTLPEPPADDGALVELAPGAAYRVRVYGPDAQDGPGAGWGFGEYEAAPGLVPWVFNRETGGWERGDVVPRDAPLSLGEAGLVILVFASLGFGLAVTFALGAGLGWVLAELAALAGGWGLLALWSSAISAAVGLASALAHPERFRDEADR